MKKKDMKVKVEGMEASILYRMVLRPALVSVSTRSHLYMAENPSERKELPRVSRYKSHTLDVRQA